MQHEDGYCDDCGAEVDTPQLTLDGRAICDSCLRMENVGKPIGAKRPEARDDGR